MSYEGYNQLLCKNGHLFHSDEAYYDGDDQNKTNCPFCKEPYGFLNSVELNPGTYFVEGEIDFKQFEIEPEVRETCNLGHVHVVKAAVHKIPSKEEAARTRQYFDDDDCE